MNVYTNRMIQPYRKFSCILLNDWHQKKKLSFMDGKTTNQNTN